MASARYCPSCLSSVPSSTLLRTASRTSSAPSFLLPITQHPSVRSVAQSANALKYRRKDKDAAAASKKKTRTDYVLPDLRKAQQYTLVDAMRYLRAAEVGQPQTSSKYELHIRLRTPKSGAVIRNRMRLPHPVRTDLRICVICPPDSAHAAAARAAGATLVGEESIFDAVKAGTIDFDRCVCQQDSLPKLAKSGIARILGPRGLMPSSKLGTVVKDVAASVRDSVGASEYRERFGVIRMAVGQLAFTPEEMQRNIRAFVGGVKKDMGLLSDRIAKDIHEIVLSSTHGPGLSLSGEFANLASVPAPDVATV